MRDGAIAVKPAVNERFDKLYAKITEVREEMALLQPYLRRNDNIGPFIDFCVAHELMVLVDAQVEMVHCELEIEPEPEEDADGWR